MGHYDPPKAQFMVLQIIYKGYVGADGQDEMDPGIEFGGRDVRGQTVPSREKIQVSPGCPARPPRSRTPGLRRKPVVSHSHSRRKMGR